MHVHRHDARVLCRTLPILLLLAALLDARDASALIFSLAPAVASQSAAPSALSPAEMSGAASSMPPVATPHVPVYQTFTMPPPKPQQISPIYVPASQTTSRRRHLGW
jgi:hypothetical protein